MKHAIVTLLLTGALTAVAAGPALADGQAGESTDRPVQLGGKSDPGGYGGYRDDVPTVLGGRNLPGGYGD